MSSELRFIIKIVKEASLLINNRFEVKPKGDKGDIVTNLDYEIEKYIIKEIKEVYPDFSIVSEEYNSDKELTDNCFTIDPIDGTINFANNLPLWGIQVACIKNKETCAAVIYLPKFNELYYADKNGAFMNEMPIHINNLDYTQGVYTLEGPSRKAMQESMKKINDHFRFSGSAAVNHSWLSCGKLSAVIFCYDTLWDYIPGQYIAKQAGGVIYNEKGLHIAANSEEFLNKIKENL